MEKVVRYNYPNLKPSRKYCFCCHSYKILADVAVTHLVREIEDLTSSPKPDADYYACIECYYRIEALVKYKTLVRKSAMAQDGAAMNCLDVLIGENRRAKATKAGRKTVAKSPSASSSASMVGTMFDLYNLPQLPRVVISVSSVSESKTSSSNGDIAKLRKTQSAPVKQLRIGRPIKRKLDQDFLYYDLDAAGVEVEANEESPVQLNGHADMINSNSKSAPKKRGRPRKLDLQPVCIDDQKLCTMMPRIILNRLDVSVVDAYTKEDDSQASESLDEGEMQPVDIQQIINGGGSSVESEIDDSNLISDSILGDIMNDLEKEAMVTITQSTPLKKPRRDSKDAGELQPSPAPNMQEFCGDFNSLLIDSEDELPGVDSLADDESLDGKLADDESLADDSQTEDTPTEDSPAPSSPIEERSSSPIENGHSKEHKEDHEDVDDDDDEEEDDDDDPDTTTDSFHVIQLPSQENRTYKNFSMNSNKERKSVSFCDQIQVRTYTPEPDVMQDMIQIEDLDIAQPDQQEDDANEHHPQDLDFVVESIFSQCDQIEA